MRLLRPRWIRSGLLLGAVGLLSACSARTEPDRLLGRGTGTAVLADASTVPPAIPRRVIRIREGGDVEFTATADNKAERIAHGRGVFSSVCAACHQQTGTGIPALFPPLVASDYLNADKKRAIRIVLNGLTGPVTVNGQTFNSAMPGLGLSDENVANALTFVYNNWNNAGHDVTPAEVKNVRGAPGK